MDYKATLFHANIAVKLFEFEIISPMPLRLFEQDPRRMRDGQQTKSSGTQSECRRAAHWRADQ